MQRTQKYTIAIVCFILLLGWTLGIWWYFQQKELPQGSIVSNNQEFIAYINQTFKITNTDLEFKIKEFRRFGQGIEDYPMIQWITHGNGEIKEGCFEEYVELDNKHYLLNLMKTDNKTYGQYVLDVHAKEDPSKGGFSHGTCDS